MNLVPTFYFTEEKTETNQGEGTISGTQVINDQARARPPGLIKGSVSEIL